MHTAHGLLVCMNCSYYRETRQAVVTVEEPDTAVQDPRGG